MTLKQLYNSGILMLTALYLPFAWAQWNPDAAPSSQTTAESPFSLIQPGEQAGSLPPDTKPSEGQANSSFALPEAAPAVVAVEETGIEVSDSPFALPPENTAAEQTTSVSEVESAVDASGSSSMFTLPDATSSGNSAPVDTTVVDTATVDTPPVADAPSASSEFTLSGDTPSVDVSPVELPPVADVPISQPQPDATIDELQNLSAEVLRENGTALAREGRYDEARQMLAHSLQKDPESIVTLNNLGLVMRKLGRLDEAAQAYLFAIQLDEQYALTYKNLGILLEHQGENETAIEAYRKYLHLVPGAADAADVAARADWLQQQK